ncbi:MULTISPECIES: DUF4294 domain-containing protein [unclassified Saccharicrinis]|uniref:DUF4294 domain-containing protein n=1 Tax=unclassified Saccharicrinis TaxID=2646859 RepID=UPI003D356F1E
MYAIRYIFLFLCFVAAWQVQGQSQDSIQSAIKYLDKKLVDGDTLPHIYIDEVQIVPPWKFKNKRQRNRYSKMVVNIKKTLPYARLAEKRLDEISASLDSIKGEKKRKEFVKRSEKELFNEFEKPLKKLTFSQGRMLIKLIDRETGDTSYQLIKDLKGGFSAFMWQSVARIFGSNLKQEYDARGDDAMVEHIILMIDNGRL